MSDEFFNQPIFQLSQSNLRDLERSVSPMEMVSDREDAVGAETSKYDALIQDQIDLTLASSDNPTVVMELDMDGRIKHLSKNWEFIVGTRIKKLLNRPISDVIIGNSTTDVAVFNEAIAKMVQDDDSYKIRFVTATNDNYEGDFDGGRLTPNNSFTTLAAAQMPPDTDVAPVEHDDAASHSSKTSSKVSNNGNIIELEAQGILVHDSRSGLPTHTIWTIKPFVALDLDLTLPPRLIDLLGFGSEVFETYLHRLKELQIADEKLVPKPKTLLCRICEQQIPAWFLEKHSDLCIVEHRTNEDLQNAHDAIADQRELVSRIYDTLCSQTPSAAAFASANSSSSSVASLASSASSSSAVSAVADYKGIPLPSVSADSLVPTQKSVPAAFLVKKFPFGILTRLLELCDEALAINPVETTDEGVRFSPNTERAISLILSFKPFETSDPSIKLIISDTQALINDKVEILSRLFSILKISERFKNEVDQFVLASVRETVARINEQTTHAVGFNSSGSVNNLSNLNSPIDLSSPLQGLNIQSPQPTRAKSPAVDPISLQPPPAISSVTPRDILLRGRSSFGEFTNVSSPSSSKSRKNSTSLMDGLHELNLTASKKSLDSNNSSYSSPRRNLSPAPSYDRQNLSLLQKNVVNTTPGSSPLISHPSLHLDPMPPNPLAAAAKSAKPPLSPLLVSATPSTKHSTGSIKDYEILKAISKGAFGSVFLAKRKLTGDYVAIKCLKKSDMIAKNQILNVKSERAVMMKQTDSPHVAQLYSSFQTNNYLYLVMEYLNGGDVATLLKMLGTLGNDWTRRYVAEVIVGVNDLHERGIIHRDLKPDNLLIDSTGHLKLTDFGLSRLGVIGRQNRLQRKSSTSEHAVELFRKNLKQNAVPESPLLDPITHKRTSSSTPFSLSPIVDQAKLQSGYASSPTTTDGGPGSRTASISHKITRNRSGSGSSYVDSPLLKPFLPRTSSETSFALVEDDFHVSPSQNANAVTSYALFDPKDSNNESIKFVGTPDYLAPETITGVGQNEASDWWSIGCIMFEFLFGYPPFHASSPPQVFKNILKGEIDWPPLSKADFDEVCPPDARDLIEKLLVLNSDERLGSNGADEIKKHPYFSSINWDSLFSESPSFKPALDDPESTDYFDARGADVSQFPRDEESSSDEETAPRYASERHQSDPSVRISSGGSIGSNEGTSRSGSFGGKRERRGSRLAEPGEFGTFHFRNLNVLEKQNKDVINRLKNEHLEHRNSFSSSSSESTPLGRPRGLSISGASGSVTSTGSTPTSAVPSSNYFNLNTSASASPFKRPVSPMLAANNRSSSPVREPLLGSPSMGRPLLTATSSSGDDIPDIGRLSPNDAPIMRHRSSVSSLKHVLRGGSDFSPSSSDTEDSSSNKNALLRVQKRRESSRRQVVNINELDVLYCEPIPIVRHIISNIFEKLGCIVVAVADGDELIRRATSQVKFDLIFTALKVPKIGGIDAVKLIKNTNGVNSATPVIALTAFSKDAVQSAQFNEVLEKPVDTPMLRQCLQKFRSDEAIESDTEK